MRKSEVLFYWDDKNVTHIADHGIVPEEARYVFKHPERGYPTRTKDGKFLVHGTTEYGSYLQIVFVYLDVESIDFNQLQPADRMMLEDDDLEIVYIIHARPLTEVEKRKLRSRRR